MQWQILKVGLQVLAINLTINR